jgi:hypothetical protein
MKLSVPRWGGILAVLILASGLARHATSSSREATFVDGSLELSQELEQSPWNDQQIVAQLEVAPLAEATKKTLISIETLARLPFPPLNPGEASRPETVLDTPPASPASADEQPMLEAPPQPQPQPIETAAPESEVPPSNVAGDAPAAAPAADEAPPPITEVEARTTVLNLLGGEAVYRAKESDMALAYAAAKKALRQQGVHLSKVKMLAIIDFTLPSFDRRLAIYNPRTGEESRHLVAHGHHSGELYVQTYSNVPGSLQSSPGLYRVGTHYSGEHGPSIRLHGLQKNINDHAYKRDVVLHSAWYVSYKTILENQIELGVPRIGRSHGCPAVSADDLPEVLQKLQPGSYLFIYPVPAYVPSPLPEMPTIQVVPARPATERVLR